MHTRLVNTQRIIQQTSKSGSASNRQNFKWNGVPPKDTVHYGWLCLYVYPNISKDSTQLQLKITDQDIN